MTAAASSTTAGGLSKLMAAAGLTVAGHRDRAAPNESYPYVTIQEMLAMVPDTGTSTFDDGVPPGFVEHCQVDLWQEWRSRQDPSQPTEQNKLKENPALIRQLVAALHGKRIGTVQGARTWGVKVVNVQRFVEEDNNIVHHALTVTVSQELHS